MDNKIEQYYENDYKNFINNEQILTIDEAMFFAFELAFKDRMSGMTEKDYLNRFGLSNNDYSSNNCINWGIAVTIAAKFIYCSSHKFKNEGVN